MFKKLNSLFVSGFISIFYFLNPFSITTHAIINNPETISSLAQITMIDSEGYYSYGSGFFISIDGLILTNAHVVLDPVTGEPSPDLIICTTENEFSYPECWFSARVLAHDEALDLALLYPAYEIDEDWSDVGDFLDIDTVEALNLPYVDFADNLPSLGEKLQILGYPSASGLATLVLTEGIVSGFEPLFPDHDLVYFIATDATINPGNSGGPVYNKDEKVVGVASAYSTNRLGGSYGYVISNETILYWFLELAEDGILNETYVDEVFSNDSEYFEEAEEVDREKDLDSTETEDVDRNLDGENDSEDNQRNKPSDFAFPSQLDQSAVSILVVLISLIL